jgi:predicted nucleotidyltransferase
MVKAQNPNIELLLLAVNQLGDLVDEMVFIGGCATGLLITDVAAPPIRATKDVDAIVQVVTKADYYKLSERLRDKGFVEDTSEGAPLCRWVTGNVTLDVIPTEADILGFGNQWYTAAMDNAEVLHLLDKVYIRMVSAPYFLITKLEAFDGRGDGDYILSHDIEDILAVMDGRPELIEEISQSESALVNVLIIRFNNLLKDQSFVDAASGHMPTDEVSQNRVERILDTIKEISDMKLVSKQ